MITYKDTAMQPTYTHLLLLCLIILFLPGTTTYSQPAADLGQAGQTDLESFNAMRLQINRAGMMTLGAWAVGNFVVGGIGWSRNSGSSMYFHQGNVMWNTVNAALAGFGLYGAMSAIPSSFGWHETITEHYAMEKLLLFNAGLDIGYMAAGLYLMERSKNSSKYAERFKGYGQALILQGGFLFVFDMALFAVHNRHGKMLEGILPAINLSQQGLQLGLTIQL